MAEAVLCPECGKTVPADAPQGLCPACMMQAGLASEASASAATTDEFATQPPRMPARPGADTVALPRAECVTEPISAAGATAVDIPGYEILGELGRGGMGVVYKARHIKLNRIIALKMILAGDHAGSAELARFRTEAEAIARLQHLNIVQVHEISEHDGKPFFSLEFCAGGSLAQKINGTPWRARDAARLVETLARGMDAAHQKGVIHRDLKPANILLQISDCRMQIEKPDPKSEISNLQSAIPKITDFGLARKLDEASQTQSGAIMGTPSYMAPEQASGKGKNVGPAADIYALGAILYELLTGRPPFVAATALDTVLLVVSHDPVPPRQLQSKTPKDLETICLKCLQKEPGKRYASTEALAEDLRRFQAGEPILARPVGMAERTKKWVGRRPMVAGLLTVVFVVAVVGLGAFAWAFDQTLGARDRAIDEQKKAEAATKEMKKQLRRAETLVVQVKFDHAFHQPDEKRALSVLTTAALLREPLVQENRRLRDSLGLHLANWSGHVHRLKSILSHKGYVAAAAFSPDGKTVLTGSEDSTAQLWETATGKPLGLTLQHQDKVIAVAFSPDGKTMLTGSWDKTARLWEPATGKPLGPPLQHQDLVVAVAFSPDGKTVLTGSFDKTAQLWETGTGKPLGPPLQHQQAVQAVAFSPDGKTVLTGSDDKTARLWETATGKPLGPPLQHQWGVGAVVFSPDGKTALTGSPDSTARLWEAATGKPLGPPLQHQGRVEAVAFSPDGKTVLTASADKTARLWETATSKPIGPALQHQDIVYAVAFSPDGKTVLTGCEDKTARLWETATGKQIGPPLQHQHRVVAVAFSTDGKTVLTRGGRGEVNMGRGEARLWETATGKQIGPALQHQGTVYAVAFRPDSKTVLTGSFDKTARLWETATGLPFGPPLEHQREVVAVAFSPDGKTVLTGSGDKTARLWETATGIPVGPPLQHQNIVCAVAFSPDGKTVLTGSEDRTARLWETATGLPFGPLLQHQNRVYAVAFSPDGKTVLTGSDDKTARLWETATGKPLGLPLQHQDPVFAVAFSPDGKSVLTGSGELSAGKAGEGRLWETATGKPLGPPLLHQNAVVAVAFSPDGRTVLTGSFDKTARLWETARGKLLTPPLQHQGFVIRVAFSPDGTTVLTASNYDRTARLWDMATGKLLGPPLQHQDAVMAAAFSPDGKTVLTGCADKTARLWRVPRPITGDPERVLLWIQVITVTELDEYGQVRVLDAGAWQERRQQLEKLGGPPEN